LGKKKKLLEGKGGEGVHNTLDNGEKKEELSAVLVEEAEAPSRKGKDRGEIKNILRGNRKSPGGVTHRKAAKGKERMTLSRRERRRGVIIKEGRTLLEK